MARGTGSRHKPVVPEAPPEPIAASSAMRELERMLRIVAPKDVAISILGESGTGKEILARRIHAHSSRRHGPFIPINCGAVPDALFESELFGHEKGSFTGATERIRGKIEPAHGGTLFLDEIGDLPLGVQGKLLRFLENQRFTRVGGSEKISVDVRLVCATLRSLEAEVSAGRFRADLYYRIQGITLRIPPLRERRADLGQLIRQLLSQLALRHATAPAQLTRRARAALLAHSWPGNIRELRNVLELVTLLRSGKRVRLSDLPEAVREASRSEAPPLAQPASEAIQISLADSLERSTARIVAAALAIEDGNRARAAERLGISARTIQRHLARGTLTE